MEAKDELIEKQKKQIEDLTSRLKDPALGVEGLSGMLSAFQNMPELAGMQKTADDLMKFAESMKPILKNLEKLKPKQIEKLKKK